MMNNQEIAKNFLLEKGFLYSYYWKNGAGETYEEHSHKDRVGLYTLAGSITFEYTDRSEVFDLTPGKYFEVEAGRNHIAKVGDSGWEVYVGEMIEGDS